MPARSEFIAEARRWIGRPVAPVGAQAQGVNCLGLFVAIARDVGGLERLVAVAEPWCGHAKPPSAGALLRGMKAHLWLLDRKAARPGDILIFRVGGEPQHLALITEPGIVLHADAGKGRVVEHRIKPGWRIAGAFRIPELT